MWYGEAGRKAYHGECSCSRHKNEYNDLKLKFERDDRSNYYKVLKNHVSKQKAK